MFPSARLLVPGDENALDRFLEPHTPYCYFLRSNLRQGLKYENKVYQAEYFGAFKDNRLTGVLMHGWMGNVQLYAPHTPDIPVIVDAWRAHNRQHPRNIKMFLGEPGQVTPLLKILGLTFSDLRGNGVLDRLFSLPLDRMKCPSLLGDPAISVRLATQVDENLLIQWRYDFFLEALDDPASQETLDKAKNEIPRRIKDRELFILECDGKPAAFCGVGGSLSDWKNVGPVWVVPEFRKKGYGRAVTAGALKLLQAEGLTHAVLFAIRPDAQAAYRALGFESLCDWIFDFLIKPLERL